MSWVYTLIIDNKTVNNFNISKYKKRVICVECNTCGIGFKRIWCPQYRENEMHFCSKKCKGVFQTQYNKIMWSDPEHTIKVSISKEKTWNEKSEKEKQEWRKIVKDSHNTPEYIEKITAIALEVQNRPEVKEKQRIIQTEISNRPEQIAKSSAMAKFVQNKPEVRAKTLKTQKDPSSFFNSEEAKENRSNGSKRARQNPEIQAKFDAIIRNPATQLKIRNTLKVNNSFKKSKPEDGIYKILLNNYKIERQVNIDRKILDFLLTDLNVFIEVDGLYWHGIGKTEEELLSKNNPQAKAIYKKYKQDQILNKYCLDNNIKLLRITDKIANKIIKNNDIELLKQLIARTEIEFVVCYYN